MTASSSRMMPTRQPIRMAVLLLSSLATGSPGRGVSAAKSGPAKRELRAIELRAMVNCRQYLAEEVFKGKSRSFSITCEGPKLWKLWTFFFLKRGKNKNGIYNFFLFYETAKINYIQ